MAAAPRSVAEIMELLSATWKPHDLGDPATVDTQVQLFADHVTVIEPPSLPHGGRHTGIEAYRALQRRMGELWEQTIEGADYWLCGEERAALRIVIRWTARATGRTVVLPMIDLLRCAGGQIIEVEVFLHDTKALLDTLEPA